MDATIRACDACGAPSAAPDLMAFPCGHLYRECCTRYLRRHHSSAAARCPRCTDGCSAMDPLHVIPVAVIGRLPPAAS
jgi:hypothetical protein